MGSARTKPCSGYPGAAGVRTAPASWHVLHGFCPLPFLGARSPGASGRSGRAGRSWHLWEVEAELGLGAVVSHEVVARVAAMQADDNRRYRLPGPVRSVRIRSSARAPPYLSMPRASAPQGHCLSAASCQGTCRPASSRRFEPVMLITVVPFTEHLGARHFASAKMYINVNFLHASSQYIQPSVKYR